jgi:hypothetical protein
MTALHGFLSSEKIEYFYIDVSISSLICSAINAVCMSLMDAGIMTTDMVTACSAGVLRHGTCQDLNQVDLSITQARIHNTCISRFHRLPACLQRAINDTRCHCSV